MHRIYTILLAWLVFVQVAVAQGSFPITGYDIVASAYQNNSLMAEHSIAMLPGFSVAAPGFTATLGKPYTVAGQWQGTFNWPFVAIHTHVLPTGNVLTWQGHNDGQQGKPMPMMKGTDVYKWDPLSASLSTPIYADSNIFCSGHTFLPDGRLFVAGGHDKYYYSPQYIGGINSAFTYNNSTAAWGQEASMRRNRWYPTAITLSNGNVLTISGETEPLGMLDAKDGPVQHRYQPEIWSSGTWSWLANANRDRKLPLYPMMFLAPDGRVFNAGPNVRTGYLSTANGGNWTDGPLHQLGRTNAPAVTSPFTAYSYAEHEAGTAVMYAPGKILVIGGTGPAGVTKTVERIDLNAGAAAIFEYDASMQYARYNVNSTVLPDGTVLVTGGIPNGTKNDADAILPAEIWTPPTPGSGNVNGSWATMNSMSEPRLYHSTAVLLPDGRVLSAGGGHGGEYTYHPNAEIFSPPYLFKGPRPTITFAPATISYGAAFVFDTPSPNSIDAVSWIRLSSVTHSFNMNQRFLQLPITNRSATSVITTAPTSMNDCPPGHYMVFALSNGIPSEAKIISISNNPCSATVNLTTSLTPYPCGATAQASVSGTNTGTNYHWFIDGVYMPAYDGRTSVGIELGTCRSQVTFGVEVVPMCGGPALTGSRTVTGGPFLQSGRPCACE